MLRIALLCLFATTAFAFQYGRWSEGKVVKVAEKVVEEEFPPTPYEFNYEIVDEEGNKHGRQESGDDKGYKTGSYSMQLADGRQRWVEYISNGEGTRMVVRTNEQGTDGQAPADVDLTVDGPLVTKEEAPKAKKFVYKTPAPVEKKAEPIKYKLIKVPITSEGHHY